MSKIEPTGRPGLRRAIRALLVFLLVGLTAISVDLLVQPDHAARSATSGAGAASLTPDPVPPSSVGSSPAAHTSRASSTDSDPRPAESSTSRSAARDLAALTDVVSEHQAGSVSVAVTDLASGASLAVGAARGMRLASAAKIEILETLLLRARGALTGSAASCAVPMIENSDNNAADACFANLGGSAAYAAAAPKLGLTRATTFGQGYYWGLNTSSASDQVRLLRNLAQNRSPLSGAARRYALTLLRSVEADQRWGVPVAADKGTQVAVKNGWLGVTADDGRWAVNSDAIIRYHGDEIAMSVLTQHNPDEAAGIALVEKLAPMAAAAVVNQ